MTGSRFNSARDIFAAFPGVEQVIGAAPTDEPLPTFLERLRRGDTPEDAVSVLAYALGRREGVWWAIQSVRMLARIGTDQQDMHLQAAETWVRDPDDLTRRDALRLGMGGNHRSASTWVALAAGWSGGNIGPSRHALVLAAPEMTPKAVRTAILVALATVAARDRAARLQACLDIGVRLMQPRSKDGD